MHALKRATTKRKVRDGVRGETVSSSLKKQRNLATAVTAINTTKIFLYEPFIECNEEI